MTPQEIPSTQNAEESSDHNLVIASLANPDAFSGIVERYWERLFRYVRRISFSSDEDIEDILQETFIKVYKNLNAFDGDLTFSTWIYHICRNTVIDSIRKKSSRPKTIGLDTEDFAHLFQDPVNIIQTIDAQEQLKKIAAIIESLPLIYREVLILKFLEEKSYEEIMDIVEKPKGTVASLINRGRKLLKEKAQEYGIYDDIDRDTIEKR
ncbi:MAG: sigma-70 family RNA polymerase sigma factor [Candidatus Moraniibacteriota bacterium]|nr:MAG: sigma-70 family RNA polymerase sigma factor [Candidatus Moranbacteria bacterium]